MNKIIGILRKNLFYSTFSTILSIVLLVSSVYLTINFIQWVFINSLWEGTAQDCRQVTGACWAFINEKIKFILVGFYPHAEIWRPAIAFILFMLLLILLGRHKGKIKHLMISSTVLLVLIFAILYGGFLGLVMVPMKQWSGLILTILLTTTGCVAAYPLGVLLALGRTSKLPVMRTISVIYIELIRGVPLISLLFMASVMLPFLLPPGWNVDKLVRAQLAIIFFTGAYMAEVVRGGLQAIPKGQYEASDSLGLNFLQCNMFIVLPQALKIVIPPSVGVFIAVFQDTTLVIIISMFDLLGTAKSSLADAEWLGFSREVYFFLLVLYFVFCYSMSIYSSKLEKKLDSGY